MALGVRFAKARDLLRLSRGQAAKSCGLLPRDISQIEDGTKRFIPTPYLQFLAKEVDLNSLFDPAKEVSLLHPSVMPSDSMVGQMEEFRQRLAALEAAQQKGASAKGRAS